MDSREKKELFERLDKATDKEIGLLCLGLFGKDPFQNTLLLPSVIRRTAIGGIKEYISAGKIKVDKSE
jgi:hypothetical protein